MPHIPSTGASRASHRRRIRPTHDYDGAQVGLQGGFDAADQASVDDVVGPGSIMPGTIATASFASTIRPIAIVAVLPTLPDANYPPLSYAVLTTDSRLYKNISDVWVKGVDNDDIVANSIQAGQIAAGAISTTELAVGHPGGSLENSDGRVLIDDNGVTIVGGALTFLDAYGTTALDGSGFGSSWRRFIQSGVYNAGFENLPPTPGSNIGSGNAVPFWTSASTGGATITAKSVSFLGERVIEFTIAGGTAGDSFYMEQIVPLGSSAGGLVTIGMSTVASAATATLPANPFLDVAFLDASLALVGTEKNATAAPPGGYTPDTAYVRNGIAVAIPSTAVYVRVRIRVVRGLTNGTTGTVRFHEVKLYDTGQRLVIADDVTPSTRGVIEMTSGGQLYIRAREAGNYPAIRLEGGGADSTGFVILSSYDGTAVLGGDLLVDNNADIGGVITGANGETTITPTITNAGTATFSLNTMTYQVIGNLVHFAFELVINSAGAGGGTIAVSLPFTVNGSNQVVSGFVQGFSVITDGSAYALLTSAGSSMATIRDRTNTGLARSHFVNGAICRITGTYQKTP